MDRSSVSSVGSGTTVRDGRVFAFRHGNRKSMAKSGSMRANAVFFDGHAETMDDMAMTNPSLWLPKGSVLASLTVSVAGSRTTFWPETIAKLGLTGPYTA